MCIPKESILPKKRGKVVWYAWRFAIPEGGSYQTGHFVIPQAAVYHRKHFTILEKIGD